MKPILTCALALLLVGCARVQVGPREVNAQGKEELRTFLRSVYASQGLKAADDLKAGKITADQAAKIMMTTGGAIDFPNLKPRGSGEEIFVRAEITLNGAPPPDGVPVRYFRMKHAIPTDRWQVEWESNEATWQAARP